MEKVLRVRLTGIGQDGFGEKTVFGSNVLRFIGNEEVGSAKEEIVKAFKLAYDHKFSPIELTFLFERQDIKQNHNFSASREFMDDNPYEVEKRLRSVIDLATSSPTE